MTTATVPVAREIPSVLEMLSEEEAYLYAILSDPSGLDQAEFLWHDPDADDGCFRAWPFQWSWYRTQSPLQIDQCVAQGTLVLTERGQVPIEDIRVGDVVLTHRGRWRPVTYTWDRGEQPVVTVKGHGHPGITVTLDHKFWINDDWKVPAAGDRWVTPWRFPETGVPPLPRRTYAPGRPSNVPDDITDPAFLWLYGLFVAEGSCSSSFGRDGTVNRTTFSVHDDEVEDVEQRLRKVGLRFNTHRVGTERCHNIVINSRPLATWMSEHGGRGARNKHLAPWVFGLDDLQRMAVLDGMTYGDGYTRGSGRVEYTTTSKVLAVDAKLLASSLGYFATMTRYDGREGLIEGRIVYGHEGFVVGWYMNGRHNHVDSVEPAGTAHVYDLEVAEDHSFVAESIVVSNCARSVGKTLSIKVRGCAFPLLYPGQEMVITAPELVHLEPITSLIEQQVYSTRLLRLMLPAGRSAITHRPFQMNFQNGSRIIGRIPQRDGKGVKGIHPIWLELDEAQDYPHAGWVELIETLKRGHEGAVWRAHGVTRGIRDDFYNYTQDTPDNHWKVHRFAAMQRPTWTDEERQEKIQKYKGREDPNYRRNVLGLHGDATSPIFVLHRLMACADDDETSDYNVDEYFYVTIKSEMLKNQGDSIAAVLDFPMRHKSYLGPPSGKPRAVYWVGMDIGFTVDPTEILVFVEHRPKRDQPSKLRLISRVQLVRMDHHNQVHAMLHTIDFYKPKVFAMDRGGLGLPLVQEMQEFAEHPEWTPDWAKPYDVSGSLTRIKGYNFSEKLLVEFDQTVEVQDWEDPAKEAGIYRNAKEYGSDVLRDLVDGKRMELPWDAELLRQWQGGTWMPSKGHDQYGRRRYSEGDDHTLDAARMMALGWAQSAIDEFVIERQPGPVLDTFLML